MICVESKSVHSRPKFYNTLCNICICIFSVLSTDVENLKNKQLTKLKICKTSKFQLLFKIIKELFLLIFQEKKFQHTFNIP